MAVSFTFNHFGFPFKFQNWKFSISFGYNIFSFISQRFAFWSFHAINLWIRCLKVMATKCCAIWNNETLRPVPFLQRSVPQNFQRCFQTIFHMKIKRVIQVNVNGDDAIPLYKYLKAQIAGEKGPDVEWNFAKFLVDKNGKVVKRYHPKTEPNQIVDDIKSFMWFLFR